LGPIYAQASKRGILESQGGRVRIAADALDTLDPFLVDCFHAIDASVGM
jgi:hypothetical protein